MDWKKWFIATAIRTLKTIAECAAGVLTINQVGILETDWIGVLSSSLMAGVICVLTCIKGLPELEQ